MDLTREQVEQQIDAFDDPVMMIDFINYCAGEFSQNDFDFSEELAGRAYDLSCLRGYKKGEAQALIVKASLAGYKFDYETMLTHAVEAENILSSLPDGASAGLHRILSCKGVFYYDRANYNKAAGYFKEAITLCRAAGDLDRLGANICNLATIYGQLGQYEKALESSNEALKLLENSSSIQSIIYALHNSGHYCNLMKQYPRAIPYFKKALKLSEDYKLNMPQPMIMNTLSEAYQYLQEYDEAEDILKKSLHLCKAEANVSEEIICLLRLGSLYVDMERLDEGEEVLTSALDNMQKYKVFHREIDVHDTLVMLYRKRKDIDKALYHQERYFELKKKYLDQEMNDKMHNVEADLLRQSNQRVKVISALGHEITSSLDLKKVGYDVYKSFNTLMDTSFFGIMIYDKEHRQLCSEVYIEEGVYLDPFVIDIDDEASLTALVIREERDILIHDYLKEYKKYLPRAGDFNNALIITDQEASPSSILCSPMRIGGEITGVIIIASYKKNVYTLSDLDTVKLLASYVAVAYKNAGQARVIREQNSRLSEANQRFKDDLKLSRELQLAMIPFRFPKSDFFKIYGYFNFLEEVGGDLYDVYRVTHDKTVILILDVVGHGVSAALVTAMAKILFFNKSRLGLTASQVVEAVNRELTPITGGSFTYFSLFFGIIDSRERTLEYVNAAHPEPLLIHPPGSVDYLTSTSLFVGLKKDFSYEQKVISLAGGDRLVLYTDGFFEIKGKNKQRFGEEQLLKTLLHHRSLTPDLLINKLNEKLAEFKEEEADDRTMLIVDFL